MTAIVTSDLHLTSAARDEYRWRLFPWLVEMSIKYGADALYILGDLTEAKDYHSSRLVNRMVNTLHTTFGQAKFHHIHILRGNHDGLDPTTPYFNFLSRFPWVQYYATPFLAEAFGGRLLLLPHTRDYVHDWADAGLGDADMVFMHATVAKARSETGHELMGMPPEALRLAHRAKIYSGDVHVPQQAGPVEYVGAPYPIRFGDDFAPRVLLIENRNKVTNLQPPAFHRTVIRVDENGIPWPESLDLLSTLNKGDQIKARVMLSPEQYGSWDRAKQMVIKACKDNGYELCGIELGKPEQKASLIKRRAAPIAQAARPDAVLRQYCSEQKVDPLTSEIGEELLRD